MRRKLRAVTLALAAVTAGVVPTVALAAGGPQPHATSACTLGLLGVCLTGTTTTTTSTGTTSTSSGTPVVATGPATDVTPTSATVSGTVNLNGASLSSLTTGPTCYFQYGTSPSSETSQVPCASAPGASGTSTVTADLTGLTGGQTYHYQLEVVTGGAVLGVGATTTGGGDQSLTTPSASVPPTLATAPASAVGGAGATLNGSVNPNNWTVSGCTFSLTTGSAAPQTIPCASVPSAGATAQSVSAAVTGLSQGTAYTYTLSVTYGASGSGGSGAMTETSTSNGSFTTLAASVGAPSALTGTTATLSGSVNPEGQSVSACTFYYWVDGSHVQTAPCAGDPSSITGTSPVSVSANVTGLTPKTTYLDSVILTTTSNTTAVAAFSTFATPALPPAPSARTLAATAVTTTTATLHASVDTAGQGVRACAFEFGVDPIPASAVPGHDQALLEPCQSVPSGSGVQDVTVTLRGLAPSTRYYYRVLLATYGGNAAGSTGSFRTAGVSFRPGVRILRAVGNVRTHSASFRFGRTGVPATRGSQCALVVVHGRRAGIPHYRACRSPQTYTHLVLHRTYEFFVRMGNAHGWGYAATRRFMLR